MPRPLPDPPRPPRPHPYDELANLFCLVLVINVWIVALLWGWKH